MCGHCQPHSPQNVLSSHLSTVSFLVLSFEYHANRFASFDSPNISVVWNVRRWKIPYTHICYSFQRYHVLFFYYFELLLNSFWSEPMMMHIAFASHFINTFQWGMMLNMQRIRPITISTFRWDVQTIQMIAMTITCELNV